MRDDMLLVPAESHPDKPRLPIVDIARGVAVLGMFGYHLTWDLADFGFIDAAVPFSPSFRLYSHIVASGFLALAGASLVLAYRRPFRWRAWARHLLLIAAAAALVTIASAVAFPQGLIGFGILHCICAALLVATPFLFLPPVFAVVAALLIAALPFAVASDAFNVPALIWTGLGTRQPSSNDFRSFFPWAAPTFAGLAMMAFGAQHGLRGVLARWQPRARPWRALAFGGRHSLAIYLIHQPLFFIALSGVAALVDRGTARDERAFTAPCEAKCAAAGAAADLCRSTCACSVRTIQALGLWDRARAGTLDDAETLIASRVTQACLLDQPARR